MNVLSDLLVAFQLYAVCSDCQRMEAVDLPALCEQIGGTTPIAAVRMRLRCRGCHKRTEDIRIIYVGEGAKLSGFYYRR